MAAQNAELDNLKKDIESLKNDVKSVVKSLQETTDAKIELSKDKLLENFSADEIKDAINQLKNKGKDSMAQVEENIKADPFKSVAVTFGLGFFVAWMMKK